MSLKRWPFKDPEATARALRRSSSVANSSLTTRDSEVARRVVSPVRAFGPLLGAAISSVLREGGKTKGKGKEGVTPLILKPGDRQAAGTPDNSDHDEWSDSENESGDDASDGND